MNYYGLTACKDGKDISEKLLGFSEKKERNACQYVINYELFRFDRVLQMEETSGGFRNVGSADGRGNWRHQKRGFYRWKRKLEASEMWVLQMEEENGGIRNICSTDGRGNWS